MCAAVHRLSWLFVLTFGRQESRREEGGTWAQQEVGNRIAVVVQQEDRKRTTLAFVRPVSQACTPELKALFMQE